MHTVVADELATPRVASVPDAQTQIGSGGMGNSSSRREARQRDVYQPPVAGAAAGRQQQYLYGGQQPLALQRATAATAPDARAPPQTQTAYTLRNPVHLQRDSLRVLCRTEGGRRTHHVEFDFTAECACSITIQLTLDGAAPDPPQLPPTSTVRVEEGLGQRFRQIDHRKLCPLLDTTRLFMTIIMIMMMSWCLIVVNRVGAAHISRER